METQANTVWTKAYTPNGTQVGITFAFDSNGNLPLAVDIERKLAGAGYLVTMPGVEPGEDAEPILYVCRKNHTDTKTGAIVPHIAFYSENDNLTKRWTHTYLDTPEQVAEFEHGTGLKVDSMPVYDGDLHPDRTKSKAVVKLAKTIKVVRDFYETKDGEPRRPFKRFVDTIGTPPTATTGNSQQGSDKQSETVVMWTEQEAAAFWNHWRNVEQFSAEQILGALGVQRLGEFKGSRTQAIDRMTELKNGLKQASGQ